MMHKKIFNSKLFVRCVSLLLSLLLIFSFVTKSMIASASDVVSNQIEKFLDCESGFCDFENNENQPLTIVFESTEEQCCVNNEPLNIFPGYEYTVSPCSYDCDSFDFINWTVYSKINNLSYSVRDMALINASGHIQTDNGMVSLSNLIDDDGLIHFSASFSEHYDWPAVDSLKGPIDENCDDDYQNMQQASVSDVFNIKNRLASTSSLESDSDSPFDNPQLI